MKKGFFILVASLLTGTVFAQKADLTSAILSYRKQDLNAARSYVSASEEKLADGGALKAKDLGKLWHNKGLIYMALYETEADISLLQIATDAFKTDTETEGSTFSKKSAKELLRCINAYNKAAYDRYESKDFTSALSLFEQVVDINSYEAIGIVDTANLFNATLMAIEVGESEKIIDLSSKLIDLEPSNGDYHLYLIKELIDIGDENARFNAIKRGREAAPEHTGLIFEEVNYYLAIGDNDGLLLSLETAIQAAPENKVLHFAKGTALGSLKRYTEAKNAYEASIELDPNYFDAYNNLASLYLDQTAPLVDQMNNLGLSQADQKKYNALKSKRNNLYAKAKPYLKEAVRLDGNALQVLYALKDVCYQTDDMVCWKDANSTIKSLTE